MKRLLAVFSIVTLMITPSIGQTKKFPAAIGLMGGLTEYNGDLGNGTYKFKDAKPFIGLSFGYYVTSRLDFNFNTSFGSLSVKEPHNTKLNSNLWQASTNFHIKMLDAATHKVVPYLLVGMGAAKFSKHSLKTTDGGKEVATINGNGTDAYLSFGAGVQFQLTERFNVYLQEKYAYTDHDDRDGEERNTNDAFLMHTLGISYNFSFQHDADGDGVFDKRDKCPNTPVGIKVDARGCPLDRDSDLIVDYLDSCPDIKGMLSAHGCPDTDGDGITDSEDQCPDVFGLVSLKGCPDKDGDGIADAADDCPEEKGTLAMRGCPDDDNDSVPNKDDKCPDVAGFVANKGCPEVKEEVKNIQAAALRGIQFETGKDIIRRSSFAILNKVVKAMNENPQYKLSIEGHADNIGGAAWNLKLSDMRAKAVMKYLIRKKIDAARIRAIGYGETMPLKSNATAAGRAKNRRVEFKVEF